MQPATAVAGTSAGAAPSPPGLRRVEVDVVVPVHDEAAGLARSIRTLHAYLSDRFPLSWTITIADNASTDATLEVARRIAAELGGIRVLHLDRKGRGRALRAAWSTSTAAVVAYMDVDLSTDLDALLPLVAPLVSGHSDVAIGSRLAGGSQVVRGPRREVISRTYNRIVRTTLRTSFSDAQCGFKALRADAAADLLPLVEDDAWFFDTELLAVAEHNGLRIHEVPVDWIDDPDSRVDVAATARDDLLGIARLLGRLSRGDVVMPDRPTARVAPLGRVDQLIRFASIGIVSTVVAAALFLLTAPTIGTVAANAVAFAICAVANAAANRRFTFDLRGRSGRSRHFLGTLLLGAVPLVVSTAVLVLLDLAGATGLVLPLLAVLVVDGCTAALKFVLLRRWVYAPGADPIPTPTAPLEAHR
ncbi:glycosyltransferase [Dermatobacter hominis]|uniref:glycosyltransferase n=1 Tax=Dermatobacter hominis TaxID=2884263 RepID=UPI001D10B998|nr:glycosyltransferase [Dermatobacter hominis]UDY37868.1 glycosyltransferase [Dermatobacter hominis]